MNKNIQPRVKGWLLDPEEESEAWEGLCEEFGGIPPPRKPWDSPRLREYILERSRFFREWRAAGRPGREKDFRDAWKSKLPPPQDFEPWGESVISREILKLFDVRRLQSVDVYFPDGRFACGNQRLCRECLAGLEARGRLIVHSGSGAALRLLEVGACETCFNFGLYRLAWRVQVPLGFFKGWSAAAVREVLRSDPLTVPGRGAIR